jgi:hypothetical protein
VLAGAGVRGLLMGRARPCDGMAKTSPSSAGGADHGGAGQAVVELCDATPQGMVFWSRQRFEVGAELQLRVKAAALPQPCGWASMGGTEWLNMRGYVVDCQPERRGNGAFGFRVSLLLAVEVRAGRRGRVKLKPTEEVFLPREELRGPRAGKN